MTKQKINSMPGINQNQWHNRRKVLQACRFIYTLIVPVLAIYNDPKLIKNTLITV